MGEMDRTDLQFPEQFLWGAATSAFQIEGATSSGGRGESVWDVFSRKTGNIKDNTTADVSADHYYRWREDLELMSSLQLQAYRFSLSWPRVLPEGTGRINQAGLDFYDSIVDGLLERGITPWVTLFHWDLPLALHKKGGWVHRDSPWWFAEYTSTVLDRLGDRVGNWITLNEPLSVTAAGYAAGVHAPGIHNPFKAAKAAHHLLMAHGAATERIRNHSKEHRVGISNAFSPVHPFSSGDPGIAAKVSAFVNRLFMDPILFGHYPKEIQGILRFLSGGYSDEDMKLIHKKPDFIGVNHYSRYIVARGFLPVIGFRLVREKDPAKKYTHMDWEVYPEGLYEILQWIKETYDNPVVYITENGAAFEDELYDGEVDDHQREGYLSSYLENLHLAIHDGVEVHGYFVWSLLDNFEWDYGHSRRFGIVYVDYRTLKRTIKRSGHWYSRVIQNNGFRRDDPSQESAGFVP